MLGDIAAEWLAFLVPAVAVWFGWHSLFAEKIYAVWVLDFLFAFGSASCSSISRSCRCVTCRAGEGIMAALKADTLSLTAWQVGMYGFMALASFYLFAPCGIPRGGDTAEFWFVMQIAMVAGFVTAYPVNWWLVSSRHQGAHVRPPGVHR